MLLAIFPIGHDGTWWDVKERALYVGTRLLPTQDPFAFTTQGPEWFEHFSAASPLIYEVFRIAGLPGLILLRLFLFLTTLVILCGILRDRGAMGILLLLRPLHPWAGDASPSVQVVWMRWSAGFVFEFAGLVLLANLLPEGRTVQGRGNLRLDQKRVRHLIIAAACLPFSGASTPKEPRSFPETRCGRSRNYGVMIVGNGC